ncbi:MAG: M23 family metallopeptidase [Schleiferiaceae bacterium]|nr:M23 family metallopeptidase [Schleiferiaceae bacterium]
MVILNDDTFEEKVSWKISRLNVFVGLSLSSFLLVAVTILIIALTPLKEYIPGYASTHLRRDAVQLLEKTDSLEAQLTFQKNYLNNLRNVLRGEISLDDLADSTLSTEPIRANEVNFALSREDSLLRLMVEEEERFNLSSSGGKNNLELFAFFTPVKGIITNRFDQKTGHLGVDIVASPNTPVKSCLAGTVIFAEWTAETGHVIAVQHDQSLISFYKHNSSLLKKQGDVVKAGEAIAIMGKSGELSTGPHLHFELWYQGNPVNPENYIPF